MSDCCPAHDESDSAARCPVNGVRYGRVPIRTVMHHIRSPWAWHSREPRWYFCDDPDCEVVYFDKSGSTLDRSALRTAVGAKQRSATATLCYCFGISRADMADRPETRSWLIEQTRRQICACEVRNPAGRCCLRDLPKPGA